MGGSPGQQGEPGPGGRGGQDGYAYGRCDSRSDRAGANGERGDKSGDLHVAKDGSRVSLAAGTDKRVQLHVAAVIGGDVRSLSIEVDAVAKQELRLDLGPAVDAVALTGPAGRIVNVTARLARKGNVVETRTGTGALSAAGALSLPGHLWSDLSKLDALTGGSTSHRSYIVKPGDTLWSIAQATYGDGARWRDIARLNLIDKPEQLRAGSVISLP
jgi:nucleoid-associated protein YgaU